MQGKVLFWSPVPCGTRPVIETILSRKPLYQKMPF